MKINPKVKEKIVLALDVSTIDEAKELINELKDYVGVFKVGLQFYTGNGNELFNLMNELNLKYFLDVKLMDIPNTVAKASENIISKGADFFNIHALGGKEMMQKCVEAANNTAEKLGRDKPVVFQLHQHPKLRQQLALRYQVYGLNNPPLRQTLFR